ncbi:hypothetical protein Btru_047236 [Bulinus truncatus]|nr:hypothetical protein Btru_047236 [Bulinus truncatus]
MTTFVLNQFSAVEITGCIVNFLSMYYHVNSFLRKKKVLKEIMEYNYCFIYIADFVLFRYNSLISIFTMFWILCAAQCTNGTNCVNCERNWFGPKCQIRDLMQFATMYNNLTVLTDRSDVTCEKKPRDLFDIVFNPPQFFIWIYLVFTPKTVLWLTEFHLVLNVSDVPENCTNLRQVTENLHKVYITCTKYGVTQVVSGIRLSWAGPKTLCSVYVYGGRNVALNQKINSLNIVGTLQEQPRSIVDGLKTVNCTRSRPSNDTQTLVIDLGHPKLVHEIIIYRTSRENSLYPMTNFIVALVSENDSVVFASFNQQHDRGDQVFKFSVETVDPAQKLRFYLYPSSLEEQFYYDLCEVEVFGGKHR